MAERVKHNTWHCFPNTLVPKVYLCVNLMCKHWSLRDEYTVTIWVALLFSKLYIFLLRTYLTFFPSLLKTISFSLENSSNHSNGNEDKSCNTNDSDATTYQHWYYDSGQLGAIVFTCAVFTCVWAWRTVVIGYTWQIGTAICAASFDCHACCKI